MPKIAVEVDVTELYTPGQAAPLIGVGYASIYRWMKRGKVNTVNVAGKTLIPKHEIERLKHLKAELERIKSALPSK